MPAEIFRPPTLGALDQHVLALIDQLRIDMRHRVAEPHRWFGALRRMTLARAVQGSNSIEGYHASLDDVAAAVEGEPILDASAETQAALAGYRDAMTYVLRVAQDDDAQIDVGLVKALHFMMLKHDLAKSPGGWRPGYIAVRREEDGEIVYVGPDADLVPALIDSMVDQLSDEACPVIVRAAMAHLNLVMIHPFRDGNGRMARCLQTLILAREHSAAPVFSSIEEYLGRNTQDYYAVLAEVGQGAWHPERSAYPWVQFCMTAHYRQAKTHLRRIEEIEDLWRRCRKVAQERGLPERTVGGLLDAAFGLRLRNSSYRSLVESTHGEEISELTASRDLASMVKSGLLDGIGKTRGRMYVGTDALKALREQVRETRRAKDEYDPFVVAAQDLQLSLPGA